jgi:hypothetical protein
MLEAPDLIMVAFALVPAVVGMIIAVIAGKRTLKKKLKSA